MSKIIINADGVSEAVAFAYVLRVIEGGKVSNNNEQYCYITKFWNGHTVYADKTKTGTYTFRVYKSNPT